ncbi:MAG: nicotinate-nucleotide--dimethylbenzimidazole phosphoribosyltransferase [Spirochaetaceae bacterium]|jgi:nicotinate-nucleotide--dimethylbenzimidazole phosphoribosyltransferase|nr:nicotinate-nucleotide--dimethylbenzimidazole phosphoribosyltransferase [Spirochaetaceae bacterium]
MKNSGDGDQTIEKTMTTFLDNLTKPRGSLGKLETYAIKMAKIQNLVPPRIEKKGIYVFAGDHGVAREGVSLYPQEVTRQMVLNFLSGGAGINALAGGTGWELTAVDAGVAGDFPGDAELKPKCRFVRAKIGPGSNNFMSGPAMTGEELKKSLKAGENFALDAAERGYDLTAIGDMGIGNTTTAAALLVAAGFSPEEMIDRGTGIDEKMLEHKREIVTKAVTLRRPAKTGEAILEQLGAFDLAMMTGFILGLKDRGIGCVLDGFPVTAAAYMAFMIDETVVNYLFAGHLSKVAGHRPILNALGLEPIVSLDMRLGEGTGAVIGGFIVELGVRSSREMASFSEAGVSTSGTEEKNY